jgi:hypothetical protein
MEKLKEDNDELYISGSKINIDRYIAANNYRSAFGLLLSVLDRLDDGKQKNDFITHYLDDFFTKKPQDSHLNPR